GSSYSLNCKFNNNNNNNSFCGYRFQILSPTFTDMNPYKTFVLIFASSGSLLLRKQCPSWSVKFTDPSSSVVLAKQLDLHYLDVNFRAASVLGLETPM
ncbi:hypothetical protein Ahia01_000702000, partial [Argonauta hians]